MEVQVTEPTSAGKRMRKTNLVVVRINPPLIKKRINPLSLPFPALVARIFVAPCRLNCQENLINNCYVSFVFVVAGILEYTNFDLINVVTPVNHIILQRLLTETGYPKDKTQWLIEGFTRGFDLGYRGHEQVKFQSPNLKFTIGNEVELWNKVMKEVSLSRYAGPFEEIPFEYFIQSPIGLVPKDGGTKTHLIFHLSYPRNTNKSVNANTPQELSKVEYCSFSQAIELCIKEGKGCFAGKSDLTSAFRHLGIAKRFWKFLVMKAYHPVTGKQYFLVDKCLPFGSSISCSTFQKFSDALAHIVRTKTGKDNINYLDDFFFVALLKALCDGQISTFLDICKAINFPVSLEKTFWGGTRIQFLGLIIDIVRQAIFIPKDKIDRVLDQIHKILNKPSKKMTLKQLQQLCGHLNFLCNAIVPGRAFTRQLYAHGAGLTKPNHHLNVTKEIRKDLGMWVTFLTTDLTAYNRPFFDLGATKVFHEINFATDASANPLLGAGGVCGAEWFVLQWDEDFMTTQRPSINYLELFAVMVGILAWLKFYQNREIILHCDNQSIVSMVNKTTSKCPNCMVLIRLLVMHCLKNNVKLQVRYIESIKNEFPDLLSRLKYKQFRIRSRKLGRHFNNKCTPIPSEIWPIEKIWIEQSKTPKVNRKRKIQD